MLGIDLGEALRKVLLAARCALFPPANAAKMCIRDRFSVDGRPQEPLRRRIMPIIKKRGLFKTANEVRKAVSAL